MRNYYPKKFYIGTNADIATNKWNSFFYSNENREPIHVHVSKGNASGKVWLEPQIEEVYFNGFTKSEEMVIMKTVLSNIEEFKLKWNNTSQNKFDAIEQLIFEEGLSIVSVDIHKELDLML